MRLIDADVLKQHIDKLPALPDGNFAGNHSALKALINMQPTIEPEQRWIPTRIAKPPKAGQYLVTKQQKTGVRQIATAHYNPSFDEWSGNGNFKKILAWQPLPSPYTQE